MIVKGTILSFFLIIGFVGRAQHQNITEVDLYGCWVMESDNPRELIFRPCTNVASEKAIKSSEFSLFPDGTCEFQVLKSGPFNCKGQTQGMQGTWTYDKTSKALKLLYPEGYKHESWKKFEEKFPQFNLPDITYKARFKIIDLDNDHMEVEMYYDQDSK